MRQSRLMQIISKFGPDLRERPVGKQRALKKQKSVDTSSTEGAPEGAPGEANRSLYRHLFLRIINVNVMRLKERTSIVVVLLESFKMCNVVYVHICALSLRCVILEEVHFLGHVVNQNGIHVDPSKIEVVKKWKAPTTPSEIRLFLGLAGYYQRFIVIFSKIAKPLTSLTQKKQKHEWGEKEEEVFQTLKNNLCDAPILSLSNGIEHFVVYCDASNQGLGCVLTQRGKSVIYIKQKSLQHIFNQKKLNMCQKRWIELFSDYECEIRYHPGKANVVADALSRKERVKPRRVRAMAITIQSEVPLVGDVRMVILNEAHKSRYSVHLGADKMYHDVCDIPSGLLQQSEILEWKWDKITMDLITKLPSSRSGRHDMEVGKIILDVIVAWHGVPVSIISDRDGRFTLHFWQTVHKALGTRLDLSTTYHPQTDGQSEHTIQTLEDMLRAYVIDFGGIWDVHLPLAEFSYNNNYHSSIQCASLEALYGRKCRSPVLWAMIGEGSLIGHELVLSTTNKVVLIKEKLKAAIDHQNSYADKRRKLLEFELGDRVLLKELRLPEELKNVHDTFHVSNLKKCLADANLHVPLDEIKVDKTLCFVEEPVEIMDREIKKLKRRKIALVKVRWISNRGPEFTWEHEDQMRIKYPQLFMDRVVKPAS
uniref:Integrase catalytic domain-containing protein n=1 Tax=Tanacetum cinerariifolium TaxID=118510 RepID=A0A6L2JLH0_TANCI|nr:hypothetical protein [Tanacetum cinerariifolium]